jgi:hypothetical protein
VLGEPHSCRKCYEARMITRIRQMKGLGKSVLGRENNMQQTGGERDL